MQHATRRLIIVAEDDHDSGEERHQLVISISKVS